MNWRGGPKPLLPVVVERVAARLLDLLRTGVALAVGLVPAACSEFVGQNLFSDRWEFQLDRINYLENLPLIVFGVVVALGYELLRLARKGTTAGKVALRLELRVAGEPGLAASRRRAVCRYLVTFGACVAASGVAFGVAAAVGIFWSAGRVVGLSVVSCVAVWVSCLVSALLRADRRGWHDVVAGTVLVSHYVPPPRRRTAGRDQE